MAARWYSRALRPPPDDIVPNPNDPLSVPPSTVGPDQLVTPGDPNGVVLEGDSPPAGPPPTIWPSAWSGWPADWWTPAWNGRVSALSDTAWMCIDLNSSALASMPPYLVGAAASLSTDWLGNPDPEFYNCWDEFAKDLFWAYHTGEAFLLATARYSTGYPARFHVVPAWMVTVELEQGYRAYRIGDTRVPGGVGPGSDLLHIPYRITTDTARGQGPLDAGAARVVAAETLTRYATQLASGGGIPHSILRLPGEGNAQQAAELKAQWVAARLSSIGEPAVLAGGIEWEPTQVNPKDMALVELQQLNESRICSMLGVPPFLVGLPSGGDSMTYSNVTQIFDFHWRSGLKPKASAVMGALSNWLLPRGTRVELNRDAYIEPEPLQRAQTAQILNAIVDPATGQPALSVAEIRAAERLDNSTPVPVSDGVLR